MAYQPLNVEQPTPTPAVQSGGPTMPGLNPAAQTPLQAPAKTDSNTETTDIAKAAQMGASPAGAAAAGNSDSSASGAPGGSSMG